MSKKIAKRRNDAGRKLLKAHPQVKPGAVLATPSPERLRRARLNKVRKDVAKQVAQLLPQATILPVPVTRAPRRYIQEKLGKLAKQQPDGFWIADSTQLAD